MYLLIVEDDKKLCSILEYQLNKNKIKYYPSGMAAEAFPEDSSGGQWGRNFA